MKQLLLGLITLGSITAFAEGLEPVSATIQIKADSEKQCARLHRMVFEQSHNYAENTNMIIAVREPCKQSKPNLNGKFRSTINIHHRDTNH